MLYPRHDTKISKGLVNDTPKETLDKFQPEQNTDKLLMSLQGADVRKREKAVKIDEKMKKENSNVYRKLR